MSKFVLGLDFGTNSVRTVIVDVSDGSEVSSFVYDYEKGERGVIIDPKDANVARQHPSDYIKGLEVSIKACLKEAKK